MIILEPTRLHWIKDDGSDDPSDLCAHSPVRLQIDGKTLVDPTHGDVTVSASAVYLLRTLERNHTPETPVGEHLFPCCGHELIDSGDDDVLILGCPHGFNVWLAHHREGTVVLTTLDGATYTVCQDQWREAVKSFSDSVRQFYERSLPKIPADADRDGYNRMMREWDRRRSELSTCDTPS